MSKSSKRLAFRLILILTILAVVFIFANSLASQDMSAGISSQVTAWLRAWLTPVVGEDVLTEHLVRKLAHVIESFILGVFLALLFRKFSEKPFFYALLTAVIDESIQIFSQRGSSLQDVWLDFLSASVAILLVLLILKMRRGKIPL